MAKKMRLTGVQVAALRHIASGRSARGHIHMSTYYSLVQKRLISDPETVTIAGLNALEELDAKQSNEEIAGYRITRFADECGEVAQSKMKHEAAAEDSSRLEWLVRHLPGNVLRDLIGEVGHTGDLDEVRESIDSAIDIESVRRMREG